MDIFQERFYQLPDRDGCVKASYLWSNGDVTFLLVPDTSEWLSPLSVVVARDVDGDGIFQRAERYWLNDEDEATLNFLRSVFDGTTMN
jgi:hypothetical protein